MDNTTPMKAKDYDNDIEKTIPFYNHFYKQTIDLLKSFNKNKGKCLDTGCGTGQFVFEAIKEFSTYEFVLCDPSKAMINEAKTKLMDTPHIVDFHTIGSQNLSFVDEFNIITAIQSHHYLQYEERIQAVRNCYTALQQNGVLVIYENFAPSNEVSKKIVLDRWGRYQKDWGKSKYETQQHLKRYNTKYFPITLQEHLTILRNSGFRVVEPFWLSYMQVGIYAIK